MTIKENLIKSFSLLKKVGIKTYQLDSEVLMMHLLSCSKEWLYINIQITLTKKQEHSFFKLVAKRQKRIPISHITGSKEFYGIHFFINKDVLTPRPETEILVEDVLNFVKGKKAKVDIAEIGTGSGCISIALAKNMKLPFSIYATDISQKALKIAIKNSKGNKVFKKITFSKESLLSKTSKKFDIIVSNPPYVKPKKNMQKETQFEPQRALFPTKNFLQKFLKDIDKHLKSGGYAFIEIDPYQKPLFKKEIKNKNYKMNIEFKKDYFNKTRFAAIQKLA